MNQVKILKSDGSDITTIIHPVLFHALTFRIYSMKKYMKSKQSHLDFHKLGNLNTCEERKKKGVHWPKPKNQLNCLWLVGVGGAHSPPSFSHSPTTKWEGAGSEKSWRPGWLPLLLGASCYIGSRRRNWAAGQELPSMGVLESVFGSLGASNAGRCFGSL